MVKANAILAEALAEYADTETRYVKTLEAMGLKFAPAHESDERIAALRTRLREAGACFRNAGASIVAGGNGRGGAADAAAGAGANADAGAAGAGAAQARDDGTPGTRPWLSYACEVCTGALNSETFSTTFACHRDCYFCFNRNQADYERFFRDGCPWEEGLESAQKRYDDLAVVGLTGGEPLLSLEDSLRFLARAGELWPDAHKRMYTSGDLLTQDAARRLGEAGLQEIRFSVKVEDTGALQEKVLANMELAARYIPDVVVEMPVIPGTEARMKELFAHWDAIGIRGVNLLEFCFPFCKWEEFDARGFTLRNPPFEVMYDFNYSGGLAVEGSEELALSLMLWGLEQGVGFGMHYCSLENKHRSEMRQRNEHAGRTNPVFDFDDGDMYLKAGKVFGPDVEPARAALAEAGCTQFLGGAEEGCLVFPVRYLPALAKADVAPALSVNLIEQDEKGSFIMEVALKAL